MKGAANKCGCLPTILNNDIREVIVPLINKIAFFNNCVNNVNKKKLDVKFVNGIRTVLGVFCEHLGYHVFDKWLVGN